MRKKSTRKALKDIEKTIQLVNKVISTEYADKGIVVNSKVTTHALIGHPVVNLTLSIQNRHDLVQHLFQDKPSKKEIRSSANLLLEQFEEVQALEAFKARKARAQDTKPLPTLS